MDTAEAAAAASTVTPPPLPAASAIADGTSKASNITDKTFSKVKSITLQSVVTAKWPARKTATKVLTKLKKVGITDAVGLRQSLQPPNAECKLNKLLVSAGTRPFVAETVEMLLLLLDGKEIDRRAVNDFLVTLTFAYCTLVPFDINQHDMVNERDYTSVLEV